MPTYTKARARKVAFRENLRQLLKAGASERIEDRLSME
jgi:hypothetical protein